MGEPRRFHQPLEDLIIDAVELELEEQEKGRDIGELGIDIAMEFGAGGIDRVADVIKLRVGADATEKIRQPFIGLDCLPELIAGERSQLAAISLREGLGLRLPTLEVG